MLGRKANSKTIFVLVVAIVLTTSTLLNFPSTKIALDEGIEIVKGKSHEISTNLKWEEIEAAGIKVTEKSWKGFLQVCERLVMDFGNAKIYLDLEARVMFVYADPTASESEKEAYYVQFL